MLGFQEAIKQLEIVHLTKSLAWKEFRMEKSFESFSKGIISTMSSLDGVADAIALAWSSDLDWQKLMIVANDVYMMGTELFWSNL